MRLNSFQIIRDTTCSKDDFLYFLYNKLGCDFRIFILEKDANGDKVTSTWHWYSELMELAPYQRVPNTRYTRTGFIKRATHRTILDIELMVDVDSPGKAMTTEILARQACNKLIGWGMKPVLSTTGNRGYHISTIIPELRELSAYRRKQRRRWYLLQLAGFKDDKQFHKSKRDPGIEIGKDYDGAPIAMEGEKHWKSGQIKQVIT